MESLIHACSHVLRVNMIFSTSGLELIDSNCRKSEISDFPVLSIYKNFVLDMLTRAHCQVRVVNIWCNEISLSLFNRGFLIRSRSPSKVKSLRRIPILIGTLGRGTVSEILG